MYIKWENFKGWCRGVSDGDSITVERGSLVLKIRLAHVDAPESGQPLAAEARDVVKEWCFEQWVHVHPIGSDRYGRIVAEIKTMQGLDVSAELLRLGLAWWKPMKKRDESYGHIQEQARKERVGLHGLKGQIKPWEYRKQKRWVTK